MIDGQLENALLCFIFAYPRKASEIAFDLPLSDTFRGKRRKVVAAKRARARKTAAFIISAIITDVQITRRHTPVRFAPTGIR